MKGEQRKDSTVRVDRGDAGSRNTVVGAAEGKNLRALRRMDVELPALVKALSYIAYFKDAQGCYLAVNREYERRSGFKPGEMIGKTAEELFPQDVAEDIRKRDEETLRRGKPIRFERPKIYPSGETKIIETIKAPLYDSDGKIVGIVGVDQDITDRKRMEEELANERDLLRTLIDHIPDAVYFKDVQGRYFLVNRAFLNRPFLGGRTLSQEDVAGKTVEEVYPGFAEQFRKKDEEVLSKGKVLRCEWQTTNDKCERFFLETLKAPIYNSKSNLTGLVGVTRNITDRKRMEEKLKETERMAAIGEMAAIVGHDLRNPLQVIIDTLYFAERKLETLPSTLSEKQDLMKRLEKTEKQARYMNKIVSDLESYAQPVKIKSVETVLRQLISEALSTLAVPESIQVSLEAEDALKCRVDPELMKRVFANLILNAVQSMPDGGKLIIRAIQTEEAAAISVQDTGVGIPKENLPRIFQPLFTTKAKGQGFGLAVCKRIVEAHNGNIVVDSQVGKGSIFTIKILFRRND